MAAVVGRRLLPSARTAAPHAARVPAPRVASQLLRAAVPPHRWAQGNVMNAGRGLALTAADLDKKMGEVNDLFVEARELIADALDSQGSTYFEDDLDVRVLAVFRTWAWHCAAGG